MRFAFISDMYGYPWGGSEELWSRAAERLADRGDCVGAAVYRREPLHSRVRQLSQRGIDLFQWYSSPPDFRTRLWLRLRGQPVEDQMTVRLFKWLSTFKPDLVCLSAGSTPNAHGLTWLTRCDRRRLPYVIINQAHSEAAWPSDHEAARLANIFQAARRCFFVSQRNREWFEFHIGEPLMNADVVRNPFNVAYDSQCSWPSPNGVWRLACVARLEPLSKGQDLLLRVLAQDKWKGRNVRLAFFGSGHSEAGLRKLAARYSLQGVEFRGQVDGVEQIWREHHALVLPSRAEGTPLALTEAMLCSRLAILTDVAGNGELIEDGVNGFIGAAPTVPLLDEAMERAWTRRNEWETMGRAARERVVALFPSDPVKVFSDRLVSLIE